MAKYVALVSGELAEQQPITSSAGGADASKIIQTDGSGRLDPSVMPVGIGADTKSIQASENLAAGDLVNVHDATGARVRKADASNGREAHGFVLGAVTSGANALVYFEGTITGLTGLTAGTKLYLSAAAAGTATATPPASAGNLSQRVGVATSATEMSFEPQPGVTVA